MSGVPPTDYSQYMNWPVIKTPSGGVYYQVPGTAYVYDPFLSASKGRPVLYQNPKPQLDEQQEQKDAVNEQRKMAKRAASPMGQVGAVAGSVGGAVASKYIYDSVFPDATSKAVEALAGKLGTTGAQNIVADATANAAGKLANAAVSQGVQQGASTTAEAFANNALNAPDVVGVTRVPTPTGGPSFLPSVDAIPGMMFASVATKILAAQLTKPPKTKLAEEMKLKRLQNAGVDVKDFGNYQRRLREDLPADFVGYDNEGNYVNNKFFNSRDIKDLTAEDLMERAIMPDLFVGSPDAMREVAQAMVDGGMVSEGNGQIQSILTPELEALAESKGLKLRTDRSQSLVSLSEPGTEPQAIQGLSTSAQERKRDKNKKGWNNIDPQDPGADVERFNPFSEKFDKDVRMGQLGFNGSREDFMSQYEARKAAALAKYGTPGDTAAAGTPEIRNTPPPASKQEQVEAQKEPSNMDAGQPKTQADAFLQGAGIAPQSAVQSAIGQLPPGTKLEDLFPGMTFAKPMMPGMSGGSVQGFNINDVSAMPMNQNQLVQSGVPQSFAKPMTPEMYGGPALTMGQNSLSAGPLGQEMLANALTQQQPRQPVPVVIDQPAEPQKKWGAMGKELAKRINNQP